MRKEDVLHDYLDKLRGEKIVKAQTRIRSTV